MIIPSQIQIETVAGLCNVRCIMCPVDQSIRKEIMSNENFEVILKKFLPYKEHIKNISLLGLGESLIDPDIAKKVLLSKTINGGYEGVGIYTNGMLLSKELSIKLLEAKLDTLILSLDGITQNTQDVIRIGSKVDKIISNVTTFLEMRNANPTFKTRIVIRFTEQDINTHQWKEFYDFWESKIDFSKNDIILKYPVHNFGNMKKEFTPERYNMQGIRCKEVYERIIIFSDGEIGLCCGDQFGYYKNENIFNEDPIEVYNRGNFKHYREEMDKGNILDLDLCKNCSVAYSIISKKEYKK